MAATPPPPDGDDYGWDVVDDEFGFDSCGSLEIRSSLMIEKCGTHLSSGRLSDAISHADSVDTSDTSKSIVLFNMAAEASANDNKFGNDELDRERATSLAWLLGGVHTSDRHEEASSDNGGSRRSEFSELDRQRTRGTKLGWILGGVYSSDEHRQWDKKQRAKKGDSMSADNLPKKQINMYRGIPFKTWLVETGRGTEKVHVLEDSGSALNWISKAQIERLGLNVKHGNKVFIETFTSHEYSTGTYVDITWRGNGSYEGTDRFYQAPELADIGMLAGNRFMEKYPGIFEEEEPIVFHLLTLQSKEKTGERQQIEASRSTAREESMHLEKTKKRRIKEPAPSSRIGTQSTTHSDADTLVSMSSKRHKQ